MDSSPLSIDTKIEKITVFSYENKLREGLLMGHRSVIENHFGSSVTYIHGGTWGESLHFLVVV